MPSSTAPQTQMTQTLSARDAIPTLSLAEVLHALGLDDRRRLRLHVVEVQVAGAAIEPDEDGGGVFLLPPRGAGVLLGVKDVSKRRARHAGDSKLNETSPADPVAVRRWLDSNIDPEHGHLRSKVKNETDTIFA